jgi:hypothetical protein
VPIKIEKLMFSPPMHLCFDVEDIKP